MHKTGQPGIGKTFIIFLLVHMLRMKKPMHKIYLATINDVLLDQLKEQGRRFGIEVVYLSMELLDTIQKPAILIVDEYKQALLDGTICFDSNGELDGIFNLGKCECD